MQSCVVFGIGGSLVVSQDLPAEILLGVVDKGMEVRCSTACLLLLLWMGLDEPVLYPYEAKSTCD